MQNPLLKFRRSSISKKPGYLSEKFWRALTTIEFYIFVLRFCTRFLLTNVYKMVFGISFTMFTSSVIDKPSFCECVETRSFLIFANNSRFKQN